MEQEKKRRQAGKPYNKWSHAEKIKLIETRISLDDMFTSNINDGWRCIAERFGDPRKDLKACRQLWKNMSQKFKSFFEQHTGNGAGDDAAKNWEMESWPYFQLFHQYASKKHSYHSPFLLESSSGVVSLEPPPPTGDIGSELMSSPRLSSSLEFTSNEIDSPTSPVASTSRPSTLASVATLKFSAYEKHCINCGKKLSKQMGALMAVFGQIFAKDYPDIIVDNLVICSSSENEYKILNIVQKV